MRFLPTSKCISLFNDRILIYHNTLTFKGFTVYTMTDGIIKFVSYSEINGSGGGKSVFAEGGGEFKDKWKIRTYQDRFWKLADNEYTTIFRLTDEELLLIYAEDI